MVQPLQQNHVLIDAIHPPPFLQQPTRNEPTRTEEAEADLIVRHDMRHQLMEMQVAEGILTKQTESLVRISFAPVFLPDENAYLCMGMQRPAGVACPQKGRNGYPASTDGQKSVNRAR